MKLAAVAGTRSRDVCKVPAVATTDVGAGKPMTKRLVMLELVGTYPVGVKTRGVAASVPEGRMIKVVGDEPEYPAVRANVARGPMKFVAVAGTRSRDSCRLPAVANRDVGAGKPITERVVIPPNVLIEL